MENLSLASAIAALDHMLRGIYFPLSVFGTADTSSWRWLEHAAWVVFEDVFLIYSIIQTRSDMWKDAIHQADATLRRKDIEKIVVERTRELEEIRPILFIQQNSPASVRRPEISLMRSITLSPLLCLLLSL